MHYKDLRGAPTSSKSCLIDPELAKLEAPNSSPRGAGPDNFTRLDRVESLLHAPGEGLGSGLA